METTLRTLCIIPHEARDDEFFDAVFEDGVRAFSQGRLHSLFFSHVLSPAHDIAGHVVGPLLNKVRQGGSAALIVALPEDETNGVSADSAGATSGEKLGVSLELYTHLLPLLFRSAERCCFARVSAITFSVKEKKLHDLLQRCEVRSERDVQYQLIEREGSSSKWGAIVNLLHDRHAQLEQGGILPLESMVVVRVDLEGYGTVVLAEVGCGQKTLDQLTLFLRSGGVCGSKTYPPRGLLSCSLRDMAPPAALVHVVGIPDPPLAPRSSMRLLRFMSSMSHAPAAEPTEVSLQTHGAPQQRKPQQGDTTRLSPVYPSPVEAADEKPVVAAAAGASRKPVHPYAWMGELFVDPSQCAHALSHRQSATSAPTWDWGTTRPEQPCSGIARATSSCATATPVKGALVEEDVPRVSREQTLVDWTTTLDRTNRELTEALLAAKAEIKHSQGLQQSFQEALRQKQDTILSLTASSEKMRQDNVDYAKLVPRLLRKIKGLEKEKDTLQQTLKGRDSQGSELQENNRRLQAELQRLQREMKCITKKETQRLREQALIRIGTSNGVKRTAEKVSGRATSPKRVRSVAVSPMPNASGRSTSGGAAEKEGESGSTLLGAIEELRRRNMALEAEVQTLRRERTATDGHIEDHAKGAAAEAGEQRVMFTACETMRDQLCRLTEELHRTYEENERLRRLVTDRSLVSSYSPATVRDDVVSVVAASLMAGCESLCAQLKHMEAEVRRKETKGVTQTLTGCVFREHVEAVTALEAAVRDIDGRRYRGAESYESIVPASATAADAEHFSNLLSFELERETHLRAFVPTFAQLSVATEHLKMRVFPSDG
ncbi:hypothetical protein TraAM80_08954 [Trypanosoma rangeli]|uniref:Uncharacterized protein n=1 Tax=Trypanosoma rangeli TaxID=5698 RepID=A0A422MY74_TRYRA|nr:uncharacterized protein TraAM80_08954 [Trypanosoma rangeli]RNE98129.1 hypothetical protein TraAM80_08954 [Trypanosoma rangeli]|eukprot:RNE98129.1 hypothetical protein TraAM80_08954 [Trypanosoma rangeli]